MCYILSNSETLPVSVYKNVGSRGLDHLACKFIHLFIHSDAQCYDGWVKHGSSCYGFGEDDVTWAGAAVSRTGRGGDGVKQHVILMA